MYKHWHTCCYQKQEGTTVLLGILNHLKGVSLATAEVYKPLQKLTKVKAYWARNRMYKSLYDRAEKMIKNDACMKFYDTSRPLYLGTDASGIGLGVRLLQVRDGMNCGHEKVPDNAVLDPIAFATKSLSSAGWYYSRIEWEALEYYMAYRHSTITVLQRNYTLLLTTSHWW